MHELKRLSKEAIPGALEKAERYRLLNEPVEAESICRDILEVEPDHQAALVVLILALSDQLEQHLTSGFSTAEAMLPRLHDEYSRAYYHGILCERRAKVLWRRSAAGSGQSVYGWLHEAMTHYDRASALRPAGHDDAILRWNTCARILNAHPELQPAPADTGVELLE